MPLDIIEIEGECPCSEDGRHVESGNPYFVTCILCHKSEDEDFDLEIDKSV